MYEPFPTQIQLANTACDPIVGKAPGDAEPVPEPRAVHVLCLLVDGSCSLWGSAEWCPQVTWSWCHHLPAG